MYWSLNIKVIQIAGRQPPHIIFSVLIAFIKYVTLKSQWIVIVEKSLCSTPKSLFPSLPTPEYMSKYIEISATIIPSSLHVE